jgi:hypothetical protein
MVGYVALPSSAALHSFERDCETEKNASSSGVSLSVKEVPWLDELDNDSSLLSLIPIRS